MADGLISLSFSINLETPLYVTTEPYLSFNVDAASLYQGNEFGRLNFTDSGFRQLGKQFCEASSGGAVMRIGGSAADDLVFLGNNVTTDNTQRIHVDNDYWDSIIDFSEFTGLIYSFYLRSFKFANSRSASHIRLQARVGFMRSINATRG